MHDDTSGDADRTEPEQTESSQEVANDTKNPDGGKQDDVHTEGGSERTNKNRSVTDDPNDASKDVSPSDAEGERRDIDDNEAGGLHEKITEQGERIAELEAQIEQLETEIEDYERRNDHEHTELRKYAGEELAREMLQVKDTLMDAIEMEDLESDTERRLRLVGEQFDRVFTSGRIERIEPEQREMYNDDLHRMSEKVNAKNYESEQIVRVQEIGYRINDRVLRTARVVVAK